MGILQARILLQGVFLTQESNLGLLHYRQILYHLSHQGSLQIALGFSFLWLSNTPSCACTHIHMHMCVYTHTHTYTQFSSVTQLCPTFCDTMDYCMPGFPVLHQPPELTQTHVHGVGDAIQPSHPLPYPSPAFNPSQHQGLFQWLSSLHQVAKVLEFQLQHQSFQWIFRVDFL